MPKSNRRKGSFFRERRRGPRTDVQTALAPKFEESRWADESPAAGRSEEDPALRFPPATILVACDLSPRSIKAWRFARTLAQRFGAKVEAIYVSLWTPAVAMIPALPLLTSEERARLEKRMRKSLSGAASIRIAEGDVPQEILRAAQQSHADLIVLATHGFTGLRRWFQGSVTEAVVRRSPIPVLSMHAAAKPIRSILAPVKLAPYSIAGFHFAQDVARSLGAALTMLHATEPPVQSAAALPRLRTLVEGAQPTEQVALKVIDGEPVAVILKAAPQHDLVVLVAHREGIFHDAFIGTTAEQVLRRSKVPVLTVPAFAQAGRRAKAVFLPGPGASRRSPR